MRVLTRRYGNLTWDGIIRGTGVVALLAIPSVRYSPAAIGELVGFVLVTIWVNGPLGVFLPATYEPILMLFGRHFEPFLIASLGILGTLYVEFLNYHLYRRVLQTRAMRRVRESRTVRVTTELFRRAPFLTVWLCSWSPLPYWAVRILGPMAGYPMRRYLLATFLGRFPRLWFFAALGGYWHVSAQVLMTITVASVLVGLVVWTVKAAAPSSQPA